NRLASFTGRYHFLRKVLNAFLSSSMKINWSHKIFATARTVKFFEMEYGVAIEHFDDCFSEMRKIISQHNFQTLFPIEIRFVKKDDLWLSASFEKDVVYFAVHMHRSENPSEYFKQME